MEPLAEENKKLREAMNLSEKNIQRAQCKRDLEESNSWDLEYQRGVLSEKLAIKTLCAVSVTSSSVLRYMAVKSIT